LSKIQTAQCKEREMLENKIQNFKDLSLDEKLSTSAYNFEFEMNNNIAENILRIIKYLKLTNVHLLGKSNGAWIVTLLLLKDTIFKGLYLAVPGIPYAVDYLDSITDQKRLEEINFVFSWVHQDGFTFSFGIKSNQEKARYDAFMTNLKLKIPSIKYKSEIFCDGRIKENSKISHELHPDMINLILDTLD
jgi:pimeloyl-ACP methyl ester carboxylesterase